MRFVAQEKSCSQLFAPILTIDSFSIDVLNKSDKERAKQLRTTLADSMREWCAYPDGEAYALLNVAYEQVWGFVFNTGSDLHRNG